MHERGEEALTTHTSAYQFSHVPKTPQRRAGKKMTKGPGSQWIRCALCLAASLLYSMGTVVLRGNLTHPICSMAKRSQSSLNGLIPLQPCFRCSPLDASCAACLKIVSQVVTCAEKQHVTYATYNRPWCFFGAPRVKCNCACARLMSI